LNDPMSQTYEKALKANGTADSFSAESLGRKAMRSVGWVVVERWGNRLATLLSVLVLGRLLAPSDFGLVAMALIFITISGLIVEQGYNKALIQRQDLRPEHMDSTFWTSLVVAVVFMGATVAASPYIARAVNAPELSDVLRWLSVSLLIRALTCTPYALLERDFQFKTLAIRRLLSTVSGAVVGVAMAYGGFGVWSLVAQTLVSSGVGLFVLWAATDWRPRGLPSSRALRELWPVGFSTLGIELLSFVGLQVDRIAVAAFLGTEALGWYFMAMKIVTIMIEIFSSVFAAVSMPVFSRLQSDKAQLCTWLYRLTGASSAVALPCFALAAALAPLLLPWLLGAQWTPSVPIFQILALLGAVDALAYFDRNALLASGQSKEAFLLTLGQSALGAVLVFAAAPFGVIAVAIAVVARQYLYWPIRVRILKRAIGVEPRRYFAQWVRPFVAALLMSMAVVALQWRWPALPTATLIHLIAGGLLGGALYLAALRVIYPRIYLDAREMILRQRRA
jgi:O-antigen/teichoic acid export membrane protein